MSILQQGLRKHREGEVTAVSAVTAEERQSALVIATWEGKCWVLPWAQFVSAQVDGERIDLSFASCLVIVTGKNLHGLLDLFAAYRVAVLREFPADYRRKLADGEPFISRIEVRPANGSSDGEGPA